MRHAAEAEDDELVAEILVEYHLVLIRNGSWQTLVHWVKSRPDEVIVEHPVLATAAATAVTLLGGSGLERRRFLALADRSRAERPDLCDPLIESAAKAVRAMALEGGVAQALWDGRSAVSIAGAAADELMVSSLAAHARALYHAGEIDEARNRAIEALEHPDVERRPPEMASARQRRWPSSPWRAGSCRQRAHMRRRRERSSAASAAAGAGWEHTPLPRSEASLRQKATWRRPSASSLYAERFLRDDFPSVHHACGCSSCSPASVSTEVALEAAEDAMCSARVALSELEDAGCAPRLAAEVEDELEAAKCRANGGGDPRASECRRALAVLTLLESDLSAPQIATKMFLSANTVRSHTRSIYRKLGVNSRADAVARAEAIEVLARTDSPM